MNRHFESFNIAANYAKYRTEYTKEVSEKVMQFYYDQQSDHHLSQPELMVDIGCGSGQSTFIFQPYFQQLIGVDVSPEQLKQARLRNCFDNVQFIEGSGENISLKDNSVDLLVAAAAVHWFDLTKFYKEAKRILKPSGCLALIGYHNPTIQLISDPNEDLTLKATALFLDFYTACADNDAALRKCYEPGLDHYNSIFQSLPFANKHRNDDIHIRYPASVSYICGWMKSASTYQTYMENKIEEMRKKQEDINEESIAKVDPLPQLAKDYLSLWKLSEESINDEVAEVDFHIYMLLSKN